jgi:hypothetical protein
MLALPYRLSALISINQYEKQKNKDESNRN